MTQSCNSSNSLPLQGINICFVATFDFSRQTRVYKEACSLAQVGANVTFLGWGQEIPSFLHEAPFEVQLVQQTSPICAGSNNSVRVFRILENLLWFRNRYTVLKMISDYRNTHGDYMHELFEAGSTMDIDVVHAVDLPSLRMAYRIARKTRAKLIYDAHELWTGLVQNPAWCGKESYARELLDIERRYAPKSDLVLTVSPEMDVMLNRQYQLKKTEFLYNSGPLISSEYIEPRSPLRFVFHGAIGEDRNIRGLIEAFSQLKGNPILDIWGEEYGVPAAEYQRQIDTYGLGLRVKLRGSFSQTRMRELLTDYDVGVYTAQPLEENFEISLPNKVFDCLASGLALAMPNLRSIRALIKAEACGICLDTSTTQSIARGLQQLIDQPALVGEMKQNSIKAAPMYSWENQSNKLVGYYREVLER